MANPTSQVRNIVVNTLDLNSWPFFGQLKIWNDKRVDGSRRLKMEIVDTTEYQQLIITKQLITLYGSQLKNVVFDSIVRPLSCPEETLIVPRLIVNLLATK